MTAKIVYLSSTNWGNLGRRKVRLAHELARRDDVAAVLFVNPPTSTSVLDLMRGRFAPSHLEASRGVHARAWLGQTRQERTKLAIHDGSKKILPLTRIERLRSSFVFRDLNQKLYVAGLRRACARLPGEETVLWLNHPSQAFALDAFPSRKLCCFDWTDDWLQYSLLPFGRTEMENATERILGEADIVFAVSQHLLERARELNRNVHLAPNATDFELFSRPLSGAAPLIERVPHPRLGYVGQIAETLDFPLLSSLAKMRPGWSFVLIGPVWENCTADVAELSRLPNVHFLGSQPHDSLPTLLSGVDVCLLPHLRNALTRSMDPTKLYDYLASGKPIVSTRVAGTERFGDILYLADEPKEFAHAIGLALQEDGSASAARRELAARNTWPQRAADMWAAVRTSMNP